MAYGVRCFIANSLIWVQPGPTVADPSRNPCTVHPFVIPFWDPLSGPLNHERPSFAVRLTGWVHAPRHHFVKSKHPTYTTLHVNILPLVCIFPLKKEQYLAQMVQYRLGACTTPNEINARDTYAVGVNSMQEMHTLGVNSILCVRWARRCCGHY